MTKNWHNFQEGCGVFLLWDFQKLSGPCPGLQVALLEQVGGTRWASRGLALPFLASLRFCHSAVLTLSKHTAPFRQGKLPRARGMRMRIKETALLNLVTITAGCDGDWFSFNAVNFSELLHPCCVSSLLSCKRNPLCDTVQIAFVSSAITELAFPAPSCARVRKYGCPSARKKERKNPQTVLHGSDIQVKK